MEHVIELGRGQVARAHMTLVAGASNRYRLRYSRRVSDPAGGADATAPVDLTGWHAVCQLRGTGGELVYDLTPHITLGGDGLIDISVSDETTQRLATGSARFDLLLVNPAGDVLRLLAGTATITHVISEGASDAVGD